MRISTWFQLAALCLIAGGIQATRSEAQIQPKPPVPAKKFLLQQDFEGIGVTQKKAEDHALEQACEATLANFGWSPSPDYLREKGMVRLIDEPSKKKFDVAKEFTKDGEMIVVKMKLEITAEQARDIQKQAQNLRMKDRQKYSLLGLLGVVALLGVIGGYLRLEEATKGYFTRRLRIAAIAILLVVVAGLCVIA